MTGGVRIFEIARALDVHSMRVLDVCKQLGIRAQNQLVTVSAEDSRRIEAAVRGKPLLQPASRGVEKLLSVGAQLGLGKLEVIPRLADIDPECALFKLRKLTERLCKQILKGSAKGDLNDMIKSLSDQQLLSRKSVSCLTQLRTLGNIATHDQTDPFDSEFDLDDVDMACTALAVVLGDIASKGLLPAKLMTGPQADLTAASDRRGTRASGHS